MRKSLSIGSKRFSILFASLESKSLLAITEINKGKCYNLGDGEGLILDILYLASSCTTCLFFHVNRRANKFTHMLANPQNGFGLDRKSVV